LKKVRIVSNDMDNEYIAKSTPGGSGIFGNLEFTANPIEECEYCIFLNNNNKTPIEVRCPAENIWLFIQEPYHPGLTDWVVERHEPFQRIYTHIPQKDDSKYVNTQTCLPWHVGKSYDELTAESSPPPKEKMLSAIIGGAMDLPGHRNRYDFIQKVLNTDLPLDLFGKKIKPVNDKLEALESYMFSLAIENNSNPDMWTEKLADCFLSWTIPIYFGCTNLDKYFPEGSFVQIDINSPNKSIDSIREILASGFWQSRISLLQEARTLVLEKYQFFPFVHSQVEIQEPSSSPEPVLIPAYQRSIKAKMSRGRYKFVASCRKRFSKKKW
jgi:hypothetical protein